MAVRVSDTSAAAAGGAFALLPALDCRGGGGGDHPAAALLEVVRQGAWLGFRSAAAGGRFLQVTPELCFGLQRKPANLIYIECCRKCAWPCKAGATRKEIQGCLSCPSGVRRSR